MSDKTRDTFLEMILENEILEETTTLEEKEDWFLKQIEKAPEPQEIDYDDIDLKIKDYKLTR